MHRKVFLLLLCMVAGGFMIGALSDGSKAAASAVATPAPLFKTVTPVEARRLIAERSDLMLVDIRNPDELTEGAIEGSTLIPLWDIVKGRKILPKDRPILLICAVGGRSLALGKLLNRYGWPEIYNLKGGVGAWKEAGLPVK